MMYGMIIICGRKIEAVRLPSLDLSPLFHSTLVSFISLSIYFLPVDLYLFIFLPGKLYFFTILPGKLEELLSV